MALIKCPECNHEISDKAKVCPNCGNPMKKASLPNLSKLNKKPSKKMIVVGVATAIVLVAILGFSVFYKGDPYQRLEKRVIEIQNNPQLANAKQIESDVRLIEEVCDKWGKESLDIHNDKIMVWEDVNRVNAGAESLNKSFTDEYVQGALSERETLIRYSGSDKFKSYQDRSEKISSNLAMLDNYDYDSIKALQYTSDDLSNRRLKASLYFLVSATLFESTQKELGSDRAFKLYTPSYSKEGGREFVCQDFENRDRNFIELKDYCATVGYFKDLWENRSPIPNE
ncbi:zinc ribbon domain-containing protein [uncultured Dubosiella sp.]|uniref:zinc-ribbon domain-containing protein n=1 Tax=uncultured Dubosiella sp. TaxID=1937011 RepID=UPI00272F5612|nr:zinc ribbon domain-containing protein [uncultured Dubosiella sp.]